MSTFAGGLEDLEGLELI